VQATTLYLLRHAATEANLAQPALLQGRRSDPPLAPEGVRQAEAARDALADVAFAACYSSPLLRAAQTAALVASPHGLTPIPLEALTECDAGRWEGLSWPDVARQDPVDYTCFQADPWQNGYPGGESLRQVHERSATALDELLSRHANHPLLVVSHHVVLRVYLARLLGLPTAQVRRVVLDNAGISVVVCRGEQSDVLVLNDTAHLQGASEPPPEWPA
jgi:broad specificity phosphatase PhoE